MNYTTFTHTPESLTAELNKARTIFIEAMETEGIINKTQTKKMHMYSVVIVKKGVLGSRWNKLFTKGDDYRFVVVKVIEDLPTEKK